jgi:hypothetical protein
MTEMVVRILVELLSTLALATKQIKQGKLSESVFGTVFFTRLNVTQKTLLRTSLGIKVSRR